MIYPTFQWGEASFLDTFNRLVQDDFFSVVELAGFRDPELRKAMRHTAETASISLTYGAQLDLLSQKLDLNSQNEDERQSAIRQAKVCIDEAHELGAERMSLLSGPDPGGDQRAEATRLLVDSLDQVCTYGEEKRIPITLETFDREVEKKCLVGPSGEAAAIARTIRKDHPDFGIMYDMAHGPLLNEDPRRALAVLRRYLVHIHVGNCVKAAGHPAYGDKHPRFGIERGEHDTQDLARFLRILFDIGYLGKKTTSDTTLPIVGFEIKPMPGETPDAVIAGTKRAWRQAWAECRRG